MARKSFVRKTERAIVGAAKLGVARVRQIDVRAATAIATAAAEAAVEAVMKSLTRGEGKAGRRKTRNKIRRRGKGNLSRKRMR
jgi:uncharacterized low-complexity protein